MRLLVSVTNRVEALRAVEGGAHIIDVKNPSEGSFGANFPWVIREVREVVPDGFEMSATIGDLPNLPGTASLAALGAVVSGADYVKVGLFGVRMRPEAINLMEKVCKTLKEYNCSSKVIAAGYADFREVRCLNPLSLPEVAHKAGAHGVLVDVKMKNRGGLFDFLKDTELRKLVNESHRHGLIVALAGSLDIDDLERVFSLGADIIGVRRAVCSGKDRLRGVIQREIVRRFVKKINDLKSV
jgi:hypothetical protein